MPEPTTNNQGTPAPAVSLEDIIGPSRQDNGSGQRPSSPGTPGTPGSPGSPGAATADPGLAELHKFFGTNAEGSDPAKSTETLRPLIDMLAKGGMMQQQNQQFQQQPQQQPNQFQQQPNQFQQQSAQAPPSNKETQITFDDIDLGEASPEIAKAFKQLGERSSKALALATKQATEAREAAARVQQQYEAQTSSALQQQEQEVSQRAINFIDKLASPKYGVGQNRTLVQQIASEQVMRTAGHIIRGMQQYGQTMPIESVMRAAIIAVDGELPAAKPADTGQQQKQQAGFAPQRAPAGSMAQRNNGRGVGSVGTAGELMNNQAFLDGARAILSR